MENFKLKPEKSRHRQMQTQSAIQFSRKLLHNLLNKRPPISQLKKIHAQIIVTSHSSLTDSLIHSYLHTNDINVARILLNNYPSPSPPTLVWNLVIRAYSKVQDCSQSMILFHQMLTSDHPDDYTFTSVITSCAHQKSIVNGVTVHGMVKKNGYLSNLYVANSLMNLYATFAEEDDAHKLFDEMPDRDLFSWTTLLTAYAKARKMNIASKVFDEMLVRNDVSWAVMISGFVGCGRYVEALRYFFELVKSGDEVKLNEAIVVSALSACAHLGALDQGSWIHGYTDINDMKTSNITTALIDMYSKCGNIDCAYQIFSSISKPHVQNYTSMISGLSIHGLGKGAICVFNQMLVEKLKPNGVTILVVLNGCSHSGLVRQGLSIFYNMESSWGVSPKIEHFGCLVDLLARAGFLAKAFGVVKTMPINPDIIVWRALLSACRVHLNTRLGERIINHIGQLDSQSRRGAEILLSNLYASLGKWDSVSQVRQEMSKQKNQSDIGCSWVELNGDVHEFRVADQLHPRIVEIRSKLEEVLQMAGLVGYAANISHASFDLSDEEKEQAVAWHSEKLAVAFALMSTDPKSCIRIVKNLRTCEDCHSALKAISKVYDREIVVRDRSRFHTFRHGECSCNDYW